MEMNIEQIGNAVLQGSYRELTENETEAMIRLSMLEPRGDSDLAQNPITESPAYKIVVQHLALIAPAVEFTKAFSIMLSLLMRRPADAQFLAAAVFAYSKKNVTPRRLTMTDFGYMFPNGVPDDDNMRSIYQLVNRR